MAPDAQTAQRPLCGLMRGSRPTGLTGDLQVGGSLQPARPPSQCSPGKARQAGTAALPSDQSTVG
eukprot:3328948-Amphidinium_carterae.1